MAFFLAVAEAGGISHASKKLHTVQSNISTRIKSLEEELGVELFRRHARGVTLTNAGQAFLPYAERVTALMREAAQVVSDEANPTGSLAVGAMESTAGLRLPDLLAAYTAHCPQVDFTLTTGTTRELTEMVLAHQLDGAFVDGPLNKVDLLEEVIFIEELVLVSAQHHPDVKDIFSVPQRMMVLRSGCAYRDRLERIFADHDKPHPQFFEFGSLDGILGCVRAGMGVTLLPMGTVSASPSATRLRIHHLPAHLARAETTFIRRANSTVSPALSQFMRHISHVDAPATLRSVAP
jgi:DNA-binding transcriptional LysR family regulator